MCRRTGSDPSLPVRRGTRPDHTLHANKNVAHLPTVVLGCLRRTESIPSDSIFEKEKRQRQGMALLFLAIPIAAQSEFTSPSACKSSPVLLRTNSWAGATRERVRGRKKGLQQIIYTIPREGRAHGDISSGPLVRSAAFRQACLQPRRPVLPNGWRSYESSVATAVYPADDRGKGRFTERRKSYFSFRLFCIMHVTYVCYF